MKTAGEEREDGELCEEEEEEGGEVKKVKLSGKGEGFTPFNYDGVNFTEFTGGGRGSACGQT